MQPGQPTGEINTEETKCDSLYYMNRLKILFYRHIGSTKREAPVPMP